MKQLLIAIKTFADQIGEKLSDHPLYEVLESPISLYEDVVTPFKLTLEQLFYVCLWVLNRVRTDKCNSDEDSDFMYHHLYETYEQMVSGHISPKSISFATLVSLKSAYFCLNAITNDVPSEYRDCMEYLKSTIERHGDSRQKQSLEAFFNIDQYRKDLLWKYDFLHFLKGYMERNEKESVYEEIPTWLYLLANKKNDGAEDEVSILKNKIKLLETQVRDLEEELKTPEETTGTPNEYFTIRHVAILFEALFQMENLTSSCIHRQAFAKLIGKVHQCNYRSFSSQIDARGLDYKNHDTRKKAKEVIRYLEEVAPEVAERIRKKLTTPPKEKE